MRSLNSVVNLAGAVLALLGNVIVVSWAPLALMILFVPFAQLLILVNNWVVGILIFSVSGLLVWWAIRESRQATAWIAGVVGGLLSLVVFVAPAYFQLLVLLFQLIVLGAVLWIPGLISVRVRSLGISILSGELIFTSLLMAGAWGAAIAPLLIIGVLLFVAATLMFERAARPHELRRTQRSAAIWAWRTAAAMILLAFAPFWWPKAAAMWWYLTGSDPREVTNAMAVVASSQAPIVGQPGTDHPARVPIDAGYYDLNGRFVTTHIWQEPAQTGKAIVGAGRAVGDIVSSVGRAVGGAIKKSPLGSAYRGWAGREILKNEDAIRQGREAHERLEAHSHPSVVAKRRQANLDYYDQVAIRLQQRIAAAATTP